MLTKSPKIHSYLSSYIVIIYKFRKNLLLYNWQVVTREDKLQQITSRAWQVILFHINYDRNSIMCMQETLQDLPNKIDTQGTQDTQDTHTFNGLTAFVTHITNTNGIIKNFFHL